MTDKEYWSEFYSKTHTLSPSPFCEFIAEKYKQTPLRILDAGCGNGRDSYHLSKWHDVTGLDTSTYLPENTTNCRFYTDDFCDCDKKDYDLIFSRFSFHSLNLHQQETFIGSITKPGTKLCLEYRSDKDKNEEHSFGDDHYRNYVSMRYSLHLLLEHNFAIEYAVEDRGLAPYEDEDPYCIRIIATKDHGR